MRERNNKTEFVRKFLRKILHLYTTYRILSNIEIFDVSNFVKFL